MSFLSCQFEGRFTARRVIAALLAAGLAISPAGIALTAVAPNNAGEQLRIIFDPIPRVDGIEASADPLFEPRANIYLMSGRRRREAEKEPAA